MKIQFFKKAGAQGNALFIILIAIALFGALTTAVMKSGRSPTFKQKETITLQASEIVKYGADLQAGADMLLALGVDPGDIDFSAPGTAGYDAAPHTKKMFHPSGAGVAYKQNGISGMSDYVYSKLAEFWTDKGDESQSHADVSFGAQVTGDICQEINRSLYGTAAVPFAATAVLNNFLAGNAAVFECDAGSPVPCTQKTSMCVTDLNGGLAAGDGNPVFYAGWTLNGRALRLPGHAAPRAQEASYASSGSELYVYFHVLVAQ